MATFDAHADFAFSTVSIAPSPALTGTSLTLQSGQGSLFPPAPFNCTVWPPGQNSLASNSEIIRVNAISGDTFTNISRAQEGTSAQPIAVGYQIGNTPTAKTFQDIENAYNNGPAGAAGGMLAGTYPNPTLQNAADGSLLQDIAGNLTAVLPWIRTCEFRLSVQTNVAVPLSDINSGTLYWTPISNDGTITGASGFVWLYDGTRWKLFENAQISLILTATSGKLYDVFVYVSGLGSLTMELSAAWASNSARTDALATQDGILVKSADHTRRYVGTFRATATNQATDAAAQRFVWNLYNRVARGLFICPGYVNDNADTTYTTASTTWTEANGGTGSICEFIVGLALDAVNYDLTAQMSNSNALGGTGVGVGEDSSSSATVNAFTNPPAGAFLTGSAGRTFTPALGYHFLDTLIVVGAGTGTFVADKARKGSVADPFATFIKGTVFA